MSPIRCRSSRRLQAVLAPDGVAVVEVTDTDATGMRGIFAGISSTYEHLS
jgi:hypothetical protein